jgi:hypothetical protein
MAQSNTSRLREQSKSQPSRLEAAASGRNERRQVIKNERISHGASPSMTARGASKVSNDPKLLLIN